LEGSGGGVDASPAGGDRPSEEFDELSGRVEGASLAIPDDVPGDPSGPALFAIVPEKGAQLRSRKFLEKISGSHPNFLIHSHIQWPIPAKAKAPFPAF